jgi:hypothetical protein
MALIIIDDSSIGLAPSPDGFVIKLTEISGFPEGLQILVPFEGEQADKVFSHITQIMETRDQTEKKPIIATPQQAAEEARRHGVG